jgi:hypothetical protein
MMHPCGKMAEALRWPCLAALPDIWWCKRTQRWCDTPRVPHRCIPATRPRKCFAAFWVLYAHIPGHSREITYKKNVLYM